MSRIDVLLKAKAATEKLQERYPSDSSIGSILKQLSFLIELERGERSDASRLNEIIIGVLALKEIDPLAPDVAELLYSVAEEVEVMKRAMLK
ncbi:immunity protein Tsi6 family protein [Fulvimonas yonginensis]|uniref:Immunity protein Tsi6 family protein n=1 Tax=Fulvimonas yonginensis TaxID=1495200 RepID=A0ABU8JET0_9GAMM